MLCVTCTAQLEFNAKFCGDCGQRVIATGAPPAYTTPAAPIPPAAVPSYSPGSASSAPSAGGRAYNDYVPAGAPVGALRAIQHSECSICFDMMCTKPSGVCTGGGKRVCPHFFHKKWVQKSSSVHLCVSRICAWFFFWEQWCYVCCVDVCTSCISSYIMYCFAHIAWKGEYCALGRTMMVICCVCFFLALAVCRPLYVFHIAFFDTSISL